jgi:tRNA threonylcarbamoyladenosine biosynthesis protein TsaB
MKILAIETSTLIGSIALIDDSQLLTEQQMEIKATYSDTLFPFIDRALRDVRISIHDIDGYVVSIGPGSFTALRIGLSTIKGLALATGKPLVGIPSLDGLAHNLCFSNLLICPVLDARKGEVYTAYYKRENGTVLKKLTADRVLDPKILLDEIEEEIVFLGDGVEVYGDLMSSTLKKKAIFAPLHLKYPKASSIAQLALNKFKNNELMDCDGTSPIYVRKPEAEVSYRP